MAIKHSAYLERVRIKENRVALNFCIKNSKGEYVDDASYFYSVTENSSAEEAFDFLSFMILDLTNKTQNLNNQFSA